MLTKGFTFGGILALYLIEHSYYIRCNVFFFFLFHYPSTSMCKEGYRETGLVNHKSSLCHGPVLSKQRRSIPSAPFPVLVNLGLWLTEQKLIHTHVVFVYPPASSIESEVALSHSHGLISYPWCSS